MLQVPLGQRDLPGGPDVEGLALWIAGGLFVAALAAIALLRIAWTLAALKATVLA